MPVNLASVIAIATVLMCIAVGYRTRRVGPTALALCVGFICMAASKPSLLTDGGNAAAKLFEWAFKQIIG